MLQFIRFLRRTEGVEAARKYFLDARKSPSCTYHVYVAYASVAFCLDKDPKVLLFPFFVHIVIAFESQNELKYGNIAYYCVSCLLF